MNRCADCGGYGGSHFTGCCFIDNQYDILYSELDRKINKLQSELDAYKIALNYFIKEGGKPAEDIVKNLLKELEG